MKKVKRRKILKPVLALSPNWKYGWNKETVEREKLVQFLDSLVPWSIPMIHIHILPGSPHDERAEYEDLVDVVFFYDKPKT